MKNTFSPEETDQTELVADFGEAFGQLVRQRVGVIELRPEEGQVLSESKAFGNSEELTS